MVVNDDAKRKIRRENAYRDEGVTPPRGFSSTKSKTEPKPSLVMKPIIPFALLGALLAVGAANAASTDPVGYVSLGNTVTPATSVAANTDVNISIPLDRPSEFTGTVGSVAGSVVTLSGTPGFTAGQWIASPYILKVESGPASGLIALISANAAGTVTVVVPTGDSLASLAAGNSVSIRKAWTVKSFLAGNTIPSGTQVLLYDGVTPGQNLAPSISYTYDSGANSWTNDGTFSPGDDDVVFQGEGIIVRNNSAAVIPSIVITGEVSTTNHRLVVSKLSASQPQDNAFGFSGPVSEVIGTSGLGVAPGDQILFYDNATPGINKGPAGSATYDGTTWTDDGTFSDVTNTFTLDGGQGYVLRRANGAVGDAVWSNEPNYVQNL